MFGESLCIYILTQVSNLPIAENPGWPHTAYMYSNNNTRAKHNSIIIYLYVLYYTAVYFADISEIVSSFIVVRGYRTIK